MLTGSHLVILCLNYFRWDRKESWLWKIRYSLQWPVPIHLQLFISLNYSGHLYNLPVECKKVSVSIYPRRLSLNVTVFFFFFFWVIWTHQLSQSSYYYWPTGSDAKTNAEGGRGWKWCWWWQQWNCKCVFLLFVVKKHENDAAETINSFLEAFNWRNKLPGVRSKKKIL